MSKLKIALLQMLGAGFDQQANLAKGEAYCRAAKEHDADIALFPEMWNISYTFFDPQQPDAHQNWVAQAISSEDPFVTHFKKLAVELDMAIALTYLEHWPDAPRNTVSLIDRHGEIGLTYAKVHTCDFDREANLTHGDDFCVCTLDTKVGQVNIGAMICFDREFPESARLLMLQGAEIILVPNACGMEENRTSQLKSRAYENMLGIALANYPAPQANGHSVAFDGMAFTKNESSRNTLVVEAGEGEGVYIASFDLDLLRDYRQREVWGNAFRKPGSYAQLLSMNVEEPFIRSSDRR